MPRTSLKRLLVTLALAGAAGIGLFGWSFVGALLEVRSGPKASGPPAVGTEDASAPRDAYVARARSLLDAGDYAGAVAALDRALATSPSDSEALALQVKALGARRHYAGARAVARRILDMSPHSPLAFVLLGSIAMQEGDAATARRNLQSAADRDASSALALAQLAALDLMQGRLGDARRRSDLALELEPGHPGALRVASRLTRSVPDLIAIYKRLLVAAPEDLLTRSWLEVLQRSAAPEIDYVPQLRGRTTVPCETGADGRLYVRARVGPFAHLRLLLDTGASGLTLSEAVARGMGLRLDEFAESAGVGGARRHSHPFLVDRIDMGGMRARALMATASNLPGGFDGIINPMIFAPAGGGVTVRVRAARRAIVFDHAAPARATDRAAGPGWVTVPYLADSRHIIFRIVLGGRPANALLDTGSSADMVDGTVLERLPGLVSRPAGATGESLIGFGGEIHLAGIVDRMAMRIAGLDMVAERLFVVDLNDEAFRFPVDLDAVVGLERLAAFDLLIDPDAGRLSFRPAG